MPAKPKIAISCGDLNGISAELILNLHSFAKKVCEPVYCIHEAQIEKCARLLGLDLSLDLSSAEPSAELFEIKPGINHKAAGSYSFASFQKALSLFDSGDADAVVTLPISKKAWHEAGHHYAGHTDYMRQAYNKEGFMMLGCPQLMVCLLTDHIPLSQVSGLIRMKNVRDFLLILSAHVSARPIAVLGLNPHAGENGLLGDEDAIIEEAVKLSNSSLGSEVFIGPFPADSAFSPRMRERFRVFAAMYHDQGLIPVKTLFFDQSVNITIGHPVKRVSVDHGTAFDIAYQSGRASSTSYKEALHVAAEWVKTGSLS